MADLVGIINQLNNIPEQSQKIVEEDVKEAVQVGYEKSRSTVRVKSGNLRDSIFIHEDGLGWSTEESYSRKIEQLDNYMELGFEEALSYLKSRGYEG